MPVEQATEVGCHMQESNLRRDHDIVFHDGVSFFFVRRDLFFARCVCNSVAITEYQRLLFFVASYFMRGTCLYECVFRQS